MNLYGYSINDPINFVDLTGLCSTDNPFSRGVDVFVGIGDGIFSFVKDNVKAYALLLDSLGITGDSSDQAEAQAVFDAFEQAVAELATNPELQDAAFKVIEDKITSDARARGIIISRSMMGVVFSPLSVSATIGAASGTIQSGGGSLEAAAAAVFGQ